MNAISELRQSLLMQITATVQEKANDLCEDAADYIDHVFTGGDPTAPPEGKLWWSHHPLIPYTKQIVNAYREELGLPESPYSPTQRKTYVIFDYMSRRMGEWIPTGELRALIDNRAVEATLRSYILREAGYELEKKKDHGATFYRLLSVEIT